MKLKSAQSTTYKPTYKEVLFFHIFLFSSNPPVVHLGVQILLLKPQEVTSSVHKHGE